MEYTHYSYAFFGGEMGHRRECDLHASGHGLFRTRAGTRLIKVPLFPPRMVDKGQGRERQAVEPQSFGGVYLLPSRTTRVSSSAYNLLSSDRGF
jgi:hypothetical protein